LLSTITLKELIAFYTGFAIGGMEGMTAAAGTWMIREVETDVASLRKLGEGGYSDVFEVSVPFREIH
jgi:hypothetical protein